MGRSLRPGPSGKPAEAAAEVDDAFACQSGSIARIADHSARVKPVDRSAQSVVALEELRCVVDVLCHRLSPSGPCSGWGVVPERRARLFRSIEHK